jgi:hypothetical protein
MYLYRKAMRVIQGVSEGCHGLFLPSKGAKQWVEKEEAELMWFAALTIPT